MNGDSSIAIPHDTLTSGDKLDDMYESPWTCSSLSLTACNFDPNSEIREGIDYEVGDLESSVSVDCAASHTISSHCTMITYREYS